MWGFLGRKILTTAVLIFVLVFVALLIVRQTPGDSIEKRRYTTPAQLERAPKRYITEVQRRDFLRQAPLPEAFKAWGERFLSFDFGFSLITLEQLTDSVGSATVSSLYLLLMGLGIGLLGVPLGVYAALRHNHWQDKIIQIGTTIFSTLPGWFVFLIFGVINDQFYFYSHRTFSLRPIPYEPNFYGRNQPQPDQTALHNWAVGFPVFLVGLVLLALITNYVRSQTLEVLQEDYVRTARAKGLFKRRIIWRHIFGSSLPSLVSLLGGLIPIIFGALAVIEYVTSWQGLGRLFIDTALDHDYAATMVMFVLVASACVIFSLLTDLLYGLIDPRLRESNKKG